VALAPRGASVTSIVLTVGATQELIPDSRVSHAAAGARRR